MMGANWRSTGAKGQERTWHVGSARQRVPQMSRFVEARESRHCGHCSTLVTQSASVSPAARLSPHGSQCSQRPLRWRLWRSAVEPPRVVLPGG
jgi:hypothetical protein